MASTLPQTFVPTLPGGPLEVVISFDTTGSMYGYLEEIRGRVSDMIQRLQADIPGIRIAVFAHGDYCDTNTYVTKWEDLSTDVVKLCDFVRTVGQTGGGDAPECYELVMRQVRTELSWTPHSNKVLVLIGDNNPHNADESCNKLNVDWKEETRLFAETGITIYGVQCGDYNGADLFYKTISVATNGKHLRLAQFGSLFDTLMAVCYREGNVGDAMLHGYEKEVRARCLPCGRIAPDIDAIFASLRDDSTAAVVTPVPSPAADFATLPSSLPIAPLTTPKVKPSLAARRVSPKKASKTEPAGMKFLAKNLPLLKRENVPENNFSLGDLSWSQWILALTNPKDIPKNKEHLYVRRLTRSGYRIRRLPAPKTNNKKLSTKRGVNPALFEVAVQGPTSFAKRHVVYSAFSTRCLGTLRWDNRLLRTVGRQVEKLLNAGGKVFVRFSLVNNAPTQKSSKGSGVKSGKRSTIHVSVAKSLLKRYDYAWKKIRNVRAKARFVQKGKIVISS